MSEASENSFTKLLTESAGKDPFVLNFLFAMGELSGQVKNLTIEVSNLRRERADGDTEREEMKADIASLKTWRNYLTAAATGLAMLLAYIGDHLQWPIH